MILKKYSDIPEFNVTYDFYYITYHKMTKEGVVNDILLCGFNKLQNKVSVYRIKDSHEDLEFIFTYPIENQNLPTFLEFIDGYKNIDIFKQVSPISLRIQELAQSR